MLALFVMAALGAVDPHPQAPGGAAPPSGPALTLSDAEQNALRFQTTLRQAAGQTEAAAGRVEEARSGYLPQLTGTATYERTTGNFAPRPGTLPMSLMTANGMTVNAAATPAVSLTNSFNFWSFGITGSQLIYDFSMTANRWRAAEESQLAAASSERATAVGVLLGVRRAYFTARAQRDLARVAQEAVANQQKHVDQISELVKVGMRSQIDLVTTQTALANSRVQAVNAENGYAADLALLNQAMGLPSGRGFELTDSEMPPVAGEDGDEHALIDGALKARPEVAAADQQRRAQELTVSANRGNYGPALSAIGSLTDTGSTSFTNVATGLHGLTPNWFVGAQLSWAILQGGLTRGQVREAKGTLAALEAQAQGVRLQVTVDVVQGLLAVRAAKATIGGAEEALTNAREQLRLAEGRYQNGQGSVIELADAQVAYTTAEAQEVSARYNLAAARAQLIAAMGEK